MLHLIQRRLRRQTSNDDAPRVTRRSARHSPRRRTPLAIETLEERALLSNGDEFLGATPDANSADPFIVAKAAELGNDPVQIFNFVRNDVAFESYVGSLRGARGTLWTGAGNSLDEASLAVALFRASGIPARYAHGTLPENLARQLILSMFPEPLRVVGCLDADISLADPSSDSQLLAETRDHYWVEFDTGTGFQAADGTFAGAQIGQTFAIATETFAEVPDVLRHKVEVKLNAETTSVASNLFGFAPVAETVLDQTFNMVELVGKSLSVGQFVGINEIPSPVFVARTIVYSPYIMVNEGNDAEQEPIIRGTDFQEVHTNFPFGSEILTGLFLNVTTIAPQASGVVQTETVEKTLFDRIGFATRQGLVASAVVVNPDNGPALGELDVTTLKLSAWDQPGELLETRRAVLDEEITNLVALIPPGATALDPSNQAAFASGRVAALELTALAADAFSFLSDRTKETLDASLLARSYFVSPRIVAVRIKTEPGPTAQELTSGVEVDILRDRARTYARPGQSTLSAFAHRYLRGITDSFGEQIIFESDSSGSGFETGAIDIFLQALSVPGATAVDLSLETIARVSLLNISDEAKGRITASVLMGNNVLVPTATVTIGGRPRTAWIEFDASTGDAISVLDDGTHSDSLMARYATDSGAVAVRTTLSEQSIAELKALEAVAAQARFAKNGQQILEAALPRLRGNSDVFSRITEGVPKVGKQLREFANAVNAIDPPVGNSLFGVLHSSADFQSLGSSGEVGLAAAIMLDPIFTVPVGDSQSPTAFRIGVKNLQAITDAFSFRFDNLPPGFEGQTSIPLITIPAGETAEVGICVRPGAELPAPGTPLSFNVVVTSTSNSALTKAVTESFLMPEVHGVSLTIAPPSLNTLPGSQTTAILTLTATGNVSENISLSATLPPELSVSGLAPIALSSGESRTVAITMTAEASAPLGSTLSATINADFGPPGSPLVESIQILVRVVAPGADAIANAAVAAQQLENAALANRLLDLSAALTNLAQDCGSDGFKSQALANIDSLIGLLSADEFLSAFTADLIAAREVLANAATTNECQAAVNNLGNALDSLAEVIIGLAEHGFTLSLSPNSQVGLPLTPTLYSIVLQNIGIETTTYQLSLEGVPAGVTGMLSQSSVTLAPGEVPGVPGVPNVFVTLTSNSMTALAPFNFTVRATAEKAPEITLTTIGGFTVRAAIVEVVAVNAEPPFTDAGGQVAVTARVLNAVNRQQTTHASFVVRDPNGQQIGTPSVPVDVMLNLQTSLVTVNLGTIDTTGFANGTHTIEVTLTDEAGQPIPGATGVGSLFIGSLVTAEISVDPDVLPPGDGIVTNTLTVQAADGPGGGGGPLSLRGIVDTTADGTSVAVFGDYAYVTGTFDISIVDISDPDNPQVVRMFTPGNYAQGSAFNTLGISGNRLVVASIRNFNNFQYSLSVFDLTDPLNPLQLDNGNARIPDQLSELFLRGETFFATGAVFFTNAGDPDIILQGGNFAGVGFSNPMVYGPGGSLFPYNVGLGNNHFILGGGLLDDELVLLGTTTATGGDTQTGVGQVLVVNAADVTAMSIVATLDIPGTVLLHDVVALGNRAVVVGGTGGVQDPATADEYGYTGNVTLTVLDLADPQNPQILGTTLVTNGVFPRGVGPQTLAADQTAIDLGNGLVGISGTTLGGEPVILVVDPSDPSNILVGSVNAPSVVGGLDVAGDLVYAASADGLAIYDLDGVPRLPATISTRIPNGTGVAVVPGSFNTPPDQIITGADFDTFVWNRTLVGGATETLTWQSTVTDLGAGESREVTVGTTVSFTSQGSPGMLELPETVVSGEHIISLTPPSETVVPGETADFDVIVSNPTNANVTYNLAAAGVPADWLSLASSVQVGPQTSVVVPLAITADAFASLGDYGFAITAATAGGTSDSVYGTLTLADDPAPVDPEAHGVVAEVTPNQATVGQGTSARYVVRLTNVGSVTETFLLGETGLPPQFLVAFESTVVEVPPGVSNFREVSLVVTAPDGTAPGSYDFNVTAASTMSGGPSDVAISRVVVVGAGVEVSLIPGSGAPGSTFQMTINNTGNTTDTFDLAVSGPAALVATLGLNSVTLAPNGSRVVAIVLGSVEYAVPGSLELVATATSRANVAVTDSDSSEVTIAEFTGLATEFDPATQDLPDPGEAEFLLMVHNTGNSEDAYIAEIIATTGPVVASLAGLDGEPAQTIPLFRLPGLATGAILLNAELMAEGEGTVTVQVRSLTDGGIVAAQTATVSSVPDACEPGAQQRGLTGAGNVTARLENGRLAITGDRLLNNIRVESGPVANSLCIIGLDGTTVNGSVLPQLITGVTGSVRVTMSGASDSVLFDGSDRAISLPSDLFIRMNSTRDTLRLDGVTVAGRTKIRTGRGRDLVELVDTVLTGRSSIFTGRGDDTLRVHTSQFLSDILFDGYTGIDSLDAGLLRRPNANGDLFTRTPRVEFETLLS